MLRIALLFFLCFVSVYNESLFGNNCLFRLYFNTLKTVCRRWNQSLFVFCFWNRCFPTGQSVVVWVILGVFIADKLSFGSHRKSAEKQTYGLFTELNPSNVLQNFSYLPLFQRIPALTLRSTNTHRIQSPKEWRLWFTLRGHNEITVMVPLSLTECIWVLLNWD